MAAGDAGAAQRDIEDARQHPRVALVLKRPDLKE